MNTYAYVGGNPLSYTDPEGLFFWDVIDFGFFAQSLYKYSQCSSTDNAINLGLDALGLLPGIPALGTLRRIDDAVDATKNVHIKVLGRLEDTKVAGSWDGHDVLQIKDWTIKKNDQWVEQGIKNKQEFYIASPTEGNLRDRITNRETVFSRELNQIKDAGYVKKGNFFIHPDNL